MCTPATRHVKCCSVFSADSDCSSVLLCMFVVAYAKITQAILSWPLSVLLDAILVDCWLNGVWVS